MVSILRSKAVPPTSFLMLMPGRSGSSFVISCLQSHPQIFAENEKLPTKSPEAQREFVRDLYETPRKRSIRAVGFKTKPKDIWSIEEFGGMLRGWGARILVLDRRNLLKSAVSRVNARRFHRQSGEWNRFVGKPDLPAKAISPSEIEGEVKVCVEAMNQIRSCAEAFALPTLFVYYEDLLADREEFFRLVTSFLGVRNISMNGVFVKTTDDDLRRALPNYDELVAHFRGTALERDFLS